MRKILIGIAFTAAAFGANIEVDGFNHPESILIDGNRIAVSNVGKEPKPIDKDGDGYISLLNKKGKIIDKNFITGLNAPKGMAFIRKGFGGTLYIADVDEVKGFDANSKTQVFSLVFEGVKFLNDIAVKDSNTLYVSGSDSGKIYEVDVKTKKYKVITELVGANGLIYNEGKIYAVQLGNSAENLFAGGGRLVEIDTVSGKVTELGSYSGVLDGIQKVGDVIYFSDWVKFEKAGVIRTYNLKTKAEGELALDKIGGPADFWIDKKTHKLWIPKMLEGKVLSVDLK